ncbi:MAG: NAD(P)H-binding protein [Bacteroidota bacterium]
MTVTVIGATGNIGSKLTQILLTLGHTVRAIARHAEKLQGINDPNLEPTIGDIADTAFLTRAFTGADAVYTFIPPNPMAPDLSAYSDSVSNSILSAVKASGVKKVINLSSLGAQSTEKMGVITGLSRNEAALNTLPENVTVVHLRPGFFMENSFSSAAMVKHMGFTGSTVDPNVKISMIATADIAAYAAKLIGDEKVKGHVVAPLLGAYDLTLTEFWEKLGHAVGNPNIKYTQISTEQQVEGLTKYGLSRDFAENMAEMGHAVNEGKMAVHPRTPENTTPTTVEEFSKQFKAVYDAA